MHLSVNNFLHYGDVIMDAIASQITCLTIVYSIVYSDADQRKHQSSASLAFVRGIHRDRWIPRTNGQLRGKCFHLMTSSWIITLVLFALWFHLFALHWKPWVVSEISLFFSHWVTHVQHNVVITVLQSKWGKQRDRSISQIQWYTWQINHNVTEICAHFCYKMAHYGILDWCIVDLCERPISTEFELRWLIGPLIYSIRFIIWLNIISKNDLISKAKYVMT